MDNRIRTVVVLGSSGTIGSLVGGLVAQNSIKVYFLSRTLEGAKTGLRRAMTQARSEVISRYIECGDYDHLLESALQDADLIIESISENLEAKKAMYNQVERYRKPDTIIGTTTSSLSLSALADGRSPDFKSHFLATHFYNPPGRMRACEVACTEATDPVSYDIIKDFLKNELRREVVAVNNVPGFAGNRIAFVLFNQITSLVEEYGAEQIDYLIGPYTGRLMPPLRTIDLVGLDIHKAIVHNLREASHDHMYEELALPGYVDKMINAGFLGDKTKGGFYKVLESGKQVFIDALTCNYIPAIAPHVAFVEKAKRLIHLGLYREAFEGVKTANGREGEIVKDIFCKYIAYSYSLIGKVTKCEYGIAGIDKVMTTGFHWAAPSVIVNVLGGKEAVIDLLYARGFEIPDGIGREDTITEQTLRSMKYFIAR